MKKRLVDVSRDVFPWLMMITTIFYLVLGDIQIATYFIVIYGITQISGWLRLISKNIEYLWWIIYHYPNEKKESDGHE